ncbi:MAG: helix-turn-helix domain-containing protein [Xanthobacteraceae bacterium]
MDSLIVAAAHALAAGDLLGALKRVALRNDPPALALRGVAMAQLGDFDRAKFLLKSAARAFGPKEAVAQARCIVAEAEIALVSRDLGWPEKELDKARATLQKHGDTVNAAHALNLAARRLLLLGRLDETERLLSGLNRSLLPPASRAAYELTVAGTAIRRLNIREARGAFAQAAEAARQADIPALTTEVGVASSVLTTPAARIISDGNERLALLQDVEELFASDILVVDGCRNMVRDRHRTASLTARPVLFALARALGEKWPDDASRDTLLKSAFRARQTDDSHRARLRVEIARLREELGEIAKITATESGFKLTPCNSSRVAVLAPLADEPNVAVLAFLADGEAWSSSALAIALETSPRTVQRALEELASNGKVQSFGRGRMRRWTVPSVPGFPTTLLLPGPLPGS